MQLQVSDNKLKKERKGRVCLSFVSTSTESGGKYLTAAHYSFIDPKKMKG